MAKLELDYMEYANDAAAQDAYVSSDTARSTIFSQALDADGGAYKNYTVRAVIPAGSLGVDANEVRVTIEAGSVENLLVEKSYIGHQGAGENYDFDGNQVQLLYNASASVDIPVGTSVASDVVTFALDNTKDLIVEMYIADNAAKDTFRRVVGLPATFIHCYVLGDKAGETTPAGTWTEHITTIFGVNKIEGMIALQSYSENTIIQQGTYSLKAVAAQTDSLNDTLTKSGLSIDLSDKEEIKLYIRANRTGTNIIQTRFYDSVGGWITKDISTTSGSFVEVTCDISGIANANKSNITKIEFKILNADSDTTYYIDNIYAQDVALDNAIFFGINF